jgi:hydroxypyruvate isomerase
MMPYSSAPEVTTDRATSRQQAFAPRLRLAVAARNFADLPIDESVRRIAELGFDACDNFDWRDESVFTQFRQALSRFGVAAGVLVVNKKPDVNALACSLVDPAEREGFLEELRLCIDAANLVGCSTLEVLTGNVMPGVPRQKQMDNCVETLQAAVPLLDANGMTVVVEMLNSVVDHPGYFLDRIEDGVEMVQRVGSPRVKLLFDIYHVQVMHGNLLERIRYAYPWTGQFHFADVPGRHEPGTGEINFRNVFRELYRLGYEGYVTAEYHPTDTTFRDLAAVKELATISQQEQL